MPLFDIDADIRKAWTLPSSFYIDPAIFELSKEQIFARSWHFLGREDGLSGLNPHCLLPGFLDEPILITKTNGRINCLSNVCTHRGKILVESNCDAGLIRCSYHGRRFSLDGRFLSMPEFEGIENFPSRGDDLHPYAIAKWNGFLFTSCAPARSFNDQVHEIEDKISDVAVEDLRIAETSEYDVACHWALYCENYLEGFHIPYVHKGLNEVVDYGSYATELFQYSSLQTGFDADGNIAGRYLFIFPNMMFNFYPWGLSVNVVEPTAIDRSRIRYISYISDESKLGKGAGADLHRVELEDEAVVESVQRGIRSRFYDRGRYSPTREQGTHHFHRTIAEFIS
jgi:choline monooxygenase